MQITPFKKWELGCQGPGLAKTENPKKDGLVKGRKATISVMPAKAGIKLFSKGYSPRFRGDDGHFNSYEPIKKNKKLNKKRPPPAPLFPR
ncbi:MAG: hypothetical protein ABIM40_02675, partial [Pseudomonadota bacterium]